MLIRIAKNASHAGSRRLDWAVEKLLHGRRRALDLARTNGERDWEETAGSIRESRATARRLASHSGMDAGKALQITSWPPMQRVRPATTQRNLIGQGQQWGNFKGNNPCYCLLSIAYTAYPVAIWPTNPFSFLAIKSFLPFCLASERIARGGSFPVGGQPLRVAEHCFRRLRIARGLRIISFAPNRRFSRLSNCCL